MHTINRRRFLESSLATGALAAFPSLSAMGRPHRRGPNDELRIAVVGVRSRGRSHISGFRALENVRVVAICDVDEQVLAREAGQFEERGESVESVIDFRRLLDRDDIDCISIATPNHWHALMTVMACEAGKDVYVEKPVSHNVWEGRQMVNAARRHERIVQTGTQSRSSHAIAEAIRWLHEGRLGRIRVARGFCYKPRQSIGQVDGPQEVPDHIHYDLWRGPAPMKPLMRRNLHYDWHWVFDTGNGDLGNQGIHQMDICRWAIGADSLPARIGSLGGRFGYLDDGNTPNTLISWFDYDDVPILFEVRGLPRDKETQSSGWGSGMNSYRGVAIGCVIECEDGELVIPSYTNAYARATSGETIREWSGAENHYANFIEAVRSRDRTLLNADINEGHLSSALCHLGNISYLTGSHMQPEPMKNLLSMLEQDASSPMVDAFDRMCSHLDANDVDLESNPMTIGSWLEFDPQAERFTNHESANVLLTREYREPFVVPEV